MSLENSPPSNEGNLPRQTEDTEAILNRRKFLIQAALAGGVVGGIASAIQGAQPQVCLSYAEPSPRVCLRPAKGPTQGPVTNPPPINPPTNAPPTNAPPKPQPCLKIAPPPKPRTNPPPPRVCLSIMRKE